jgi:4-amino-4-deoxy-L-arabinose transferase-like glycosyltransferase
MTIYSFLALFKVGSVDLGTDEGRFGISAVNILKDFHQLATVSEDPLGSDGTKPFLYQLCLAGSICVFGKNEFALRAMSALMLGTTGLLLYSLVAFQFKDRLLALFTLSFFLLNPWTLTYARVAMPEPAVLLWGSLALVASGRFVTDRNIAWTVLAGAALGFAFLSKMWLVSSFAFACFSMFAIAMSRGSRTSVVVGAVVAFTVFVFVSAIHLALVAYLTPWNWQKWLSLYFGIYFKSRLRGDNGYDPSMWFRPWWFYQTWIFKSVFFGLPLLLSACSVLIRKKRYPELCVVMMLLSPVLMYSLFRVKQTSYMFPVLPALAFLLA